jgi:hypothetical protein
MEVVSADGERADLVFTRENDELVEARPERVFGGHEKPVLKDLA